MIAAPDDEHPRSSVLDRFLPARVANHPLERRRSRLIVGFALSIAPWGPVFGGIYYLLGHPGLALGLGIATVAMLGVPLWLRRGADLDAAGTLVTVLLYAAVTMVVWRVGGIRSPALPWLAAVPLCAGLLARRRTALVFGALATATALGLYAVEQAGWTPTALFTAGEMEFLYLAGIAGLVPLVVTLAVVYRDIQEQALRHAREARARLAREIDEHDRTQSTLAETHEELAQKAHLAGKAQVATNVLHDVGNALTRVDVSVDELRQQMRGSPLDRLQRTAALLEGHRQDLHAVLGPRRADLLVDYLRALVDREREHQDGTREALGELTGAVEHLKVLVRAQQSHAKAAGLPESTTLDQVIDEAVRLAGVHPDPGVERDVAPLPPILLDRHRVLQVLINLLRNAAQALRGQPTEPWILVGARPEGAHLLFEVRDNGPGIAPEDLERIFEHGYTTRPDGHGFGLHGSARAAEEMGGRLRVTSQGPGTGACFTLELPLTLVASPAETVTPAPAHRTNMASP